MQLPIQSAPEYSAELPVSKKTVRYRPFLVKEQRNMLMVTEDSTTTEMYYALVSMLQSVLITDIQVDELPMTDLEYLFIQVRAKSIGESQEVDIKCNKTEDCDGKVKMKLDLNDIVISKTDIPQDGRIQLNEELTVELAVPSSKNMMSVVDVTDESEMIRKLMLISMRKIYDKENIYELSEYRDSEIVDFLESLTIEQFTKISKFYESLPTVSIDMKGVCNKCKKKHIQSIQGFANFF
tara:strand:- start:540 stop:1253 length:714 start_codon:yes stop_codon:yes gene_type:complete